MRSSRDLVVCQIGCSVSQILQAPWVRNEGCAMSTALQQYKFRSAHRQQRLRETQGHDWVLILSWLGALLCWGFLWWAVYRLFCCVVQLIQFVPGLLP